MELLEYTFVRNALLSMLFLSVMSGVVGTVRRMSFAAGGVTHASFGGIGLSYYFGFNPTIGALLFAVLTAVSVEMLHTKEKIREDSAIAMLWSLGMAIGVIFMSLSPGYAPNLMGFMFGDVLTVSTSDIVASGVTAAVVLLLAVVFYRPVMYVSFDRMYASLSHWPATLISIVMAIVMALSISLSIKSVGIILVLSVFTIPQTIAGMMTRTLWSQMLVSGVIALIGCVLGVVFAFYFNLPAGATTTALLSVVLLASKVTIYLYMRR